MLILSEKISPPLNSLLLPLSITDVSYILTSVKLLEEHEREECLGDILPYVDFETYLKIYLAQYRYCANRAYEHNERLSNDQKDVIKALVDCDFNFIENWIKKDTELAKTGLHYSIFKLMERRRSCLEAFSIPLEEAKEKRKFLDSDKNWNLYGVIDAENKILDVVKKRDCLISIALIAKFANPACERIDKHAILSTHSKYYVPHLNTDPDVDLADTYIKHQPNSALLTDNLSLLLKMIFSVSQKKSSNIYTIYPPSLSKRDELLSKSKVIFKILLDKKKEDNSQDSLWDIIKSLIEECSLGENTYKKDLFFVYVLPDLSHEDVEELKKDRDTILQYVKDIDTTPNSPITFQNLQNLHSKLFKEVSFESFFKKHFADKYPKYWRETKGFRSSEDYLTWLANKVEDSKDFKGILRKVHLHNADSNIAKDLLKCLKLNSSCDDPWSKIQKLCNIEWLTIPKEDLFFQYVLPNLSDENIGLLKEVKKDVLDYIKSITRKRICPYISFKDIKILHSKLFSELPLDSFFKEHFAGNSPLYWAEIESFSDPSEYLDWLKNKIDNFEMEDLSKHELFFKYVLPNLSIKNFQLLKDVRQEALEYIKTITKAGFSPNPYMEDIKNLHLKLFDDIAFDLFFEKYFADKYPKYWGKKDFEKASEYLDWLKNKIDNFEMEYLSKHELFFKYVLPNLSSQNIELLKKDTAAILQYVKDIDTTPNSPITFERLKNLHSKLFSEVKFDSFFKEHFADKYPGYWKSINGFRDSNDYLTWLKDKVENNKLDSDTLLNIYGRGKLGLMAEDLRKITTRIVFKKIFNQGSIKSLWDTENYRLPKYIKSFGNYPCLLKVGFLEPLAFTTAINYTMQILNVDSNLRYMATAASLLCSTTFSALDYYGSSYPKKGRDLDLLNWRILLGSISLIGSTVICPPILNFFCPQLVPILNIRENMHLSLAASAIGLLNYASQSCTTGYIIIDKPLDLIDRALGAVLPEWGR
ncbi:MAG: hypothetical protein K0R73_374 [Candidatus Midichloriaceae bacterium]|nr:hypothetical protein [Candidatus Midichloriaceae bacterium]